MLKSYGRHLLGAIITAVVVVGNGKSPISFTADQWVEILNAAWVAGIPVALRYFNKKDPAFGKIAKDVAEVTKLELEKQVRKTVKKKAAPAKKKP